jgi:hypothetical protein
MIIGILYNRYGKGKVGENYTLVINDGDDKYEATAYLDTVAQMDSINYYLPVLFELLYESGLLHSPHVSLEHLPVVIFICSLLPERYVV